MSTRKASLRSEMHPYQNSEKLHPFWEFSHETLWGKSEATKDYFRARAEEFIQGDSNGKKWTWTKKENV